MVNVKLDKTGGLTEALALRDAARAEDFQLMVGCMVGTSLAMAPAVLVAQGAEIADLDGPLLLAEDRPTRSPTTKRARTRLRRRSGAEATPPSPS
jgi:L-Ala-D/L-Glu epimerase